MTRTDAYAWLAKTLGIPPTACHIGQFDEAGCQQVIQAIQNRQP